MAKKIEEKKLASPEPEIEKKSTRSRRPASRKKVAKSTRTRSTRTKKTNIEPIVEIERGEADFSFNIPSVSFDRDERISEKKESRSVFEKIAIAVICVIVLTLSLDIFGIYRLNWKDAFSYQVARVLHLPAGSANGHLIGLTDYFDNVAILNTAVKNNREGIDTSVLSDKQSLDDRIFNLLIVNLLVDRQLAQYNKKVTNTELDSQMNVLISQMGGKDQAVKTIRELYNLDLDQFKYKILKPIAAKELLQELIVQDTALPINQEAKKKADDVLKMALEKNVDFKILANQYTEDEAGINIGGDLGWISKGELDSDLENILFSLPRNAVYNQLVQNKTGYHILKTESRMVNKDTGKESIQARQILIKVDVDVYLKGLMDKTVVKRFVHL